MRPHTFKNKVDHLGAVNPLTECELRVQMNTLDILGSVAGRFQCQRDMEHRFTESFRRDFHSPSLETVHPQNAPRRKPVVGAGTLRSPRAVVEGQLHILSVQSKSRVEELPWASTTTAGAAEGCSGSGRAPTSKLLPTARSYLETALFRMWSSSPCSTSVANPAPRR